jgi:ATP-dependent Lhr-like helicase
MDSEDLLASVFPDQVACAENLPGGPIEIPDHPLVQQTIKDCLTEAMDVEGFERLLRGLESGEIKVVARDLTGPSPLALEVLSARPYAFLDDAPLEERRTQAVMSRGWLAPETAADLGRLDPEAIERVRQEAWPDPANADELHDALVWLGFVTPEEAGRQPAWSEWLSDLARSKRVARLGESGVWITAERLPQFQTVWPEAKPLPAIEAPASYAKDWTREDALVEIVRGRLEGLGPVTEPALAVALDLPQAEIAAALLALQAEGFAMRGRFTAGTLIDEWCERRLLARIHRYTVKRLRAEIEPVAARDFVRFLLSWQRVSADSRMEGPEAIEPVVAQLEGFEAPASAWEAEILTARLKGYEPGWLDDLCLSGRTSWARLRPRNANASALRVAPVRTTPITLLARKHAALWAALSPTDEQVEPSSAANQVLTSIREHGASFFDEIVENTGLLRPQVEEALAELVALGLVNSDSFGGLRALLVPQDRRKSFSGARRRRRPSAFGMDDAGRWAMARRTRASGTKESEAVEHIARTLLRRYGVVFWRLLEREADWLPPWRDILRVYRTLEARGEIRGGRFVTGFSGEQYALPDAVGMLREVRRQAHDGALVSVSGADPLNLVGILTPGPKLASLTGNRVLYRDGIPIAVLAGGEAQFLEQLEPAEEWAARKALLRGPAAEPILPTEKTDAAD